MPEPNIRATAHGPMTTPMTERASVPMRALLAAACVIATVIVTPFTAIAAHHPMEPQPPHVETPPGKAPADAVVLFDGSDMSAWTAVGGGPVTWTVRDGYVEVAKGGIITKREFGDIQLHLEYRAPVPAEGEGQGRGNSGIYFMGRYEIQVLDSYENPTYINGMMGAIYEQYAPLVNAARRPGEWQTYDVVFRAPRLDADGRVTRMPVMTAFINGLLVQDHREITGPTLGAPFSDPVATGPIFLQDHNNPVRFRNIWVRELTPGE